MPSTPLKESRLLGGWRYALRRLWRAYLDSWLLYWLALMLLLWALSTCGALGSARQCAERCGDHAALHDDLGRCYGGKPLADEHDRE